VVAHKLLCFLACTIIPLWGIIHRSCYFFIHPDCFVCTRCTADCGWITGHSYVTYGPLLNSATVLVFEGVCLLKIFSQCVNWIVVSDNKSKLSGLIVFFSFLLLNLSSCLATYSSSFSATPKSSIIVWTMLGCLYLFWCIHWMFSIIRFQSALVLHWPDVWLQLGKWKDY